MHESPIDEVTDVALFDAPRPAERRQRCAERARVRRGLLVRRRHADEDRRALAAFGGAHPTGASREHHEAVHVDRRTQRERASVVSAAREADDERLVELLSCALLELLLRRSDVREDLRLVVLLRFGRARPRVAGGRLRRRRQDEREVVTRRHHRQRLLLQVLKARRRGICTMQVNDERAPAVGGHPAVEPARMVGELRDLRRTPRLVCLVLRDARLRLFFGDGRLRRADRHTRSNQRKQRGSHGGRRSYHGSAIRRPPFGGIPRPPIATRSS